MISGSRAYFTRLGRVSAGTSVGATTISGGKKQLIFQPDELRRVSQPGKRVRPWSTVARKTHSEFELPIPSMSCDNLGMDDRFFRVGQSTLTIRAPGRRGEHAPMSVLSLYARNPWHSIHCMTAALVSLPGAIESRNRSKYGSPTIRV